MMHLLKKSTAASVLVGPVLDSDGAIVTASVIGDFYHTKNGGTPAALASTATATHDHNGMYVIALNDTNTNTGGRLVISYAGGTTPGVMAAKSLEVLEAATFDAIVTNAAGTADGLPLSLASAKVTAVLAATDVTGNLPSNTVQVAGTAIYSYDGEFAAVDSGGADVTLSTLDASGATIPDNAHAYSVIQVVAGTGADQIIRLGARIGARQYAVDSGSMPVLPDTSGGSSPARWIFLGTWNSKLTAAGLDEVTIETSLNARQAISIIAAALAGADTGLDTGSITIKGAGVSTTRIVATGDTSGNRSAITLTPPS